MMPAGDTRWCSSIKTSSSLGKLRQYYAKTVVGVPCPKVNYVPEGFVVMMVDVHGDLK